MVLYFTSDDEDLIKYGFPEDFHVDKLSSAHVYLRLQPDQDWTQIPEELLMDCAQLVKANSIEGRIGFIGNLLGVRLRVQIVCEVFYTGHCSSGGNSDSRWE
ncbi:hypothetical protein BC937DRAFT_93553 [Endogone sp. FLAS-F59071]|nr:hypothetical protein BC937DRAFT_93553 [Endogone sp. FLAS-F59071]|eukprot:RUS21126.1 hypothetical protein BC937DRAFT_93553 [Endogone sp. FLAS-F59071]